MAYGSAGVDDSLSTSVEKGSIPLWVANNGRSHVACLCGLNPLMGQRCPVRVRLSYLPPMMLRP